MPSENQPLPQEPGAYLEAHVAEALATDERVSTLGIEVSIRGNDVFLSGEVGTIERKQAVSEVVAELLPEHTVHNDTSASEFPPGVEVEQLS
ncbi:MAG TPA: BON domain-containing protein [Actinomycetota bacterium]|nr:BON domain-containing protein [Actinomycetota bacterium]